MIIQKINDQNIDYAFSPFGPLILKGHLDSDEKDKLLEIINKLFLIDGSDQILSGDIATAQNETIKRGKFKLIINDYVNQIIYKILTLYLNIMGHNIQHENEGIFETLSTRRNELPTVISSWCVLMKDGDYHVPHDHVSDDAMISGGIYLDIPIDNVYPNGCINWHQPMPGVHLKKNTHTVLPKTNDFYIWPSWLQHSVNTHRSEHDRKMISFNACC